MLRDLGSYLSQEVGHSIALLFSGKKEDLWTLIRMYGIENLFLRVGLT